MAVRMPAMPLADVTNSHNSAANKMPLSHKAPMPLDLTPASGMGFSFGSFPELPIDSLGGSPTIAPHNMRGYSFDGARSPSPTDELNRSGSRRHDPYKWRWMPTAAEAHDIHVKTTIQEMRARSRSPSPVPSAPVSPLMAPAPREVIGAPSLPPMGGASLPPLTHAEIEAHMQAMIAIAAAAVHSAPQSPMMSGPTSFGAPVAPGALPAAAASNASVVAGGAEHCRVLVQFKCHHAEYSSMMELAKGQYVVVQGDRGIDIGVVIRLNTEAAKQYIEKTGPTGSVLRHATQREVDYWATDLKQDEAMALEFVRSRIVKYRLAMEVRHAEYQFDKKKLTFYYEAKTRVDFVTLLKDLFREFNCRIWMEKVRLHE